MKIVTYAIGIQPVDARYYAFIPDFIITAKKTPSSK